MKTIFVSSTFKDMHFERDAIQEIVLPALRAEAMKYGESVSFCDLRWGINTGDLDSEQGSRKVLDVCLDEIDRCKPPMVVILGDRYGWIPSEELTTSAADRKNLDKVQLKRDMELEDLQISVTALEIAYGALSTPEKRSQALFYFRHIESECPDDYAVEDSEHKKKLDHLKAKIEALTGGRIKHYYVRWDGEKLDGVIPFAEMLAEDISKILLPEWKQKELLTPFERERLTHWSFITEKNEMFSARSTLVQKYYDDLTQNGKHFLAIKAPSGSGKSMLFSNLALKLRDSGYDVVPFMSGLTSESNDSIDILRNTIYFIEELLGFSHESIDLGFNGIVCSTASNGEEQKEKKNGIDKLHERLFELCVECEQADRRVVIMVDAVDQLASDDNRDNLIFIPERLSTNVKFVMTCLPELELVGRNAVTLKPMDDAEQREVIKGILKSHNREIEEKVVRKMIKLKASRNPLFLSLLIQRLLMMNRDDFLAIKKAGDDMKAISKHQLAVIATCPDSLQKMSAALLTEAGKRINEELVRKAAEYLAVSRHGLRQEDLAALLGDKWNTLDFAHFITYMDENFIQRDDGRFDFSHKCIREGFLEECHDVLRIHKSLVDYFYSLTSRDSVCAEELAYHCIMADDKSILCQYILDNEHTQEKISTISKTLLMLCESDNCKWLKEMVLRLDDRADYIKICTFIINTFDSINSNSMGHSRILYQISNFICSNLSQDYVERDDSYDLFMIKAHMWYAECNKKLLRASFYSEGKYAVYISCYEKAYAVAEKCSKYSTDTIWTYYMAECAFRLMHHNPETNNGVYGNFEVSGKYYAFYCEKSVEHFEKIIGADSTYKSNDCLIKYAICQVNMACITEYHKKGIAKIDALHRGDNPHIHIAIRVASEIEPDGSLNDEQNICQLYMELADYFLDIKNVEYMNFALFFMGKAISLLQRTSNNKLPLRRKLHLQSLLVKRVKHQIAVNRFDEAEKKIKDALVLTKELYQKTNRINMLYDVISLSGTYWDCLTQKGKVCPDVSSLISLEVDIGQYLYENSPLCLADRLLMTTIIDHGRKCLSPSEKNGRELLNAPIFLIKTCFLFLHFGMRRTASVKKNFWLTPYFGRVGGTIRLLNDYSKFDDYTKKRMLRLHRLIVFYLKHNQKQISRLKRK